MFGGWAGYLVELVGVSTAKSGRIRILAILLAAAAVVTRTAHLPQLVVVAFMLAGDEACLAQHIVFIISLLNFLAGIALIAWNQEKFTYIFLAILQESGAHIGVRFFGRELVKFILEAELGL